MKLYLVIVLLTVTAGAFAQVKVTNISKTDIPRSITYKGHIIDAVKYTDKTGDHIVVTTETGITQQKTADNDDFRSAALYAYNYAATGNGQFKLSWQVYDFSSDCPVDVKADYARDAFSVTDLDNNGLAEVWLVYRTACRGDVSPSNMKIVMHEGEKKYAVRGTSKVEVSPKKYFGGSYTFDAAFKTAPTVFRQYAANAWKKNIMDTF